METSTFISIENRRVEEPIHFTTYRQPRGLNQGNMPLHLTPSHFQRQQRNTRGHTLAGRTARWTRPLTGNSQVPAAKKTQVSLCSRTGPAQPPKKTASTQIAVVAHFQTGPATQTPSSQIAVVAVAFVCHQQNHEFADCSCSPVAFQLAPPPNLEFPDCSCSPVGPVAFQLRLPPKKIRVPRSQLKLGLLPKNMRG